MVSILICTLNIVDVCCVDSEQYVHGMQERGRILHKFADLNEKHNDELGHIETGGSGMNMWTRFGR